MNEKKFTIDEAHKFFAIELNQLTWSLLSKTERTPEENELMLHSAHASHLHWLKAGSKVHEQRGEWLLSRVYAFLNVPERAMYHALRCKKLTEENRDQMRDFDIAYADEALARAYASSGHEENCRKFYGMANQKGELIGDAEDKKIFTDDLFAEPWFGMIK